MTEQNKADHFLATLSRDSAEHNKIMSDYTYTVTHDLNAHLRHIMQYGELLKMEEKDRLSPEGAMYVDKLVINTKRLHQLVNDLLAYAHILHIKEEKENLDLNKVVGEIITDRTSIIKETRTKMDVGNLPVVFAYRFCMTQLFSHLMENAIKYRGAKDPVITINCVEKNAHYLFSVRDNGIGIPEKYQTAIFTPLKRLHSHDKIEGSGLGLVICEKAVEAHGGRIWVESHPDEGSVFFFTLPFKL